MVETGSAEIYRCEGCGEYFDEEDVRHHGDGYCHVIPVQVGYDEWVPEPCGPVVKLKV